MSFYDDASWLLIPSGIEEDIVFAQKPISGLGDLTFTRASDATYTDASGVVRRSPYNLVTWSEMFSDVAWAKTNTSISANVTNAPNGTLTADKLIAANGTSIVGDYVQQNVTKGASIISYTFTTYAKANELNGTRIYVRDSISAANFAQVYFNLITGTIDTAATSGGNFSNASATITANVNGWYRVSLTFTSSTDTQILARIYTYDTVKTTGNGTDGIFIWGAQLVEGSSALDYFPTTNRQDVPRIDFRNADGTLSSCGRLLLEPQRTNSIRNSSMVGAVAGSPGTLPTNWIQTGGGGLTRTIVGTGTENGLPYIDVRFNGTSSAASVRIDFEGTTVISALTGQTWNETFYLKTISAPNPPVTYEQLMIERTSGGVIVTSASQLITLTSNLQRFSYTRTLNGGATVAFVQPILFMVLTIGATYDFTIRIAAPQMELGAFATTWVPTTTAAVTRLADTASKTGVSSLIGQNSGTLFVEWDNSDKGIINLIETYNNASGVAGTSSILIQKTLTPNQINIRVFDSLGNYSDFVNATLPNGRNKLALAYEPGSAVYYLNGSFVGGNTRTYVFVSTRDTVGFDNRAPYPRAQAALFPTRLTNAELAQLTTL